MTTVTLKGNPVQLEGSAPHAGDKAPDFLLVDQHLANHNLSEFNGEKILISIVPSLDTPTCALSTQKFNQAISSRKDVQVLVVSADLPFAQKRMCDTDHIENILTLSMMRSKDFAKDYGVLITSGPLAGLATRAIFVLDDTGTIIYRELVEEISKEPDYDKALEALFS